MFVVIICWIVGFSLEYIRKEECRDAQCVIETIELIQESEGIYNLNAYSEDFYVKKHERTLNSARTILPLVTAALPKIGSTVDAGCGVETWLSVIMEKGVKDMIGLDGEWVDKNLHVIPRYSGDRFYPTYEELFRMPAEERARLAEQLKINLVKGEAWKE